MVYKDKIQVQFYFGDLLFLDEKKNVSVIMKIFLLIKITEPLNFAAPMETLSEAL